MNPHLPSRRTILDNTPFEERIGYARAVLTGSSLHVSGTTGYDYESLRLPPDVVGQARQCLRNLGSVLARAGFDWGEVVRVTYIFKSRADFEPCWPLFREYFGDVRPAATMFVAELVDPDILVEIEITAVKASPSRQFSSDAGSASTEASAVSPIKENRS